MYSKKFNIPNPLANSFAGKYFVGYADDLSFKEGKSAWAGLFNPPGSGVYLFVNVWTITELLGAERSLTVMLRYLPHTSTPYPFP